MLQRTVTALVTSALLGAVLLIAPAPTAAASGGFISSTISGGEAHFCALDASGAAWCWGRNDAGQLGVGASGGPDRPTPTAVSGGLKFTRISAAVNHTCALTSAGAAYCWGSNSEGQLGDGTTVDKSTPTAVNGGLKFASIASGERYTCAVTKAGTAYCWGDNWYGQIGDGTTSMRLVPTAVSGGLTFTSIDAGPGYTCGLIASGAAYCWGDNFQGQLGIGNYGPKTRPTAVQGGLKFSAIDAGDSVTCALTTVGAAYCWGANYAGLLGSGTDVPDRTTPQAVIGGHRFVNISAGDDHVCAVASTGSAYCWGTNSDGELGDGTTDDSDLAGPRLVVGGFKFVSVGTSTYSGSNTSCGITTTKAAYCWGSNGDGQVGDGTFDSTLRDGPQLVLDGHEWLLDASSGGGCDRSSRGRERCRPTR